MSSDNLYNQKYMVPDIIEEFMDNIGNEMNNAHEKPNGYKPLVGSQGALELLSDEFSTCIENVYTIGNILLEVSGEYIYAFSRAISNPLLTFAPYIIARNILETSSIVAWIFDPNISAKDRCERYYGFEFISQIKHEQFARLVASTEDHKIAIEDHENANKELQKIIADAKVKGFCIHIDNEKPTGIGKGFPSSTDLVDKYLGMGNLYRLYSAVIHGHHWALRALGFSFSRLSPEGDHLFEKYIDPRMLFLLTFNVMTACNLAYSKKFHMYGWDKDDIDMKFALSMKRIKDNLALTV